MHAICYKLSDYFSAPLSMLSGQALRLALGHFYPPHLASIYGSASYAEPRDHYTLPHQATSPHPTALPAEENSTSHNRPQMLRQSIFRLWAAMAFITLMLAAAPRAGAQEVALKTNLFYDATLTANIGAEVAVAPRWSIDLSGNLNAWTVGSDKRWKHWMIQPEARYWFCEAIGGHFVGAHLLGGQYNFGGIHLPDFLGSNLSELRHNRFEGWYGGIGVAYGYSWMLSRHWNFEAEIGFGWAYASYNKYPCATCGTRTDKGHHNYVGPTKAALNLVYVF